MEKIITGAKGGGSSGSSGNRGTEIASVAYMKILLALSEGEIAGGFTGKNIYLDGTPLLDDNGGENFPGVIWDWRPGTVSQDYISGFPAVENEISTGYEIKYGTPWVRSVTNTQLSAVRLRFKFPNGLYRMTDDGGKRDHAVAFVIELSTDGSTYKEIGRDSASGIANTGYERSYRVDLPAAKSGWNIRVTRLTTNSTDGRHADTTRIESMTEIVDAKLRYPNTALLFVQFDSKLFDGKTPSVTVKTKGMIIRVPSNYNPVTRTYSGTWDGTFKWAWSNNPAWVFFDLLTNKRYGLGKRIGIDQVDKWTLYQIAQYCDSPVSDGSGGTEARFLCDLYLSQRTDAWTVLMDLANIFRGMLSWSNNLLTVDADMPRAMDPDFVFNKSNIVGSFTFSSTSEKSNYSAAIVTYSNPANHYADDQASTYVRELSARFGFNTYEMSAIGCTRDSEGQRRGQWAVRTNSDDNAVEFKTGQEGRIPRVGKVIGISNGRQTGRANGGRISAVAGNKLTLDRLTTAKPGDTLIVNLPSGVAQSRTLSAVSGRAVTVSKAFSEVPVVEAGWVLDQSDLAIQQFRVKRVVINEDKTVTLNGIVYNPAKYPAIDSGAVIESRPVTVVPPRGQQAPTNILISASYRVEQGIGITTMEVTWDRVKNAVAYEAQWRQDGGDWINVSRTGNNRFTVDGIYAGAYVVRIRAINALDVASVWSVSTETQLTGKIGKPPAPLGLTATSINWGIKLSWGFPAGTQDTLKTEIQYSAGADFSTPLLLSDVPYPSAEYTQAGLLAGKQFWYRARLVDRTGNASNWTAVVMGMASNLASDYLDAIKDQVLLAADGKALTEKIDFSIAGILQNTLTDIQNAKVSFQQFGIARAEISSAQTLIADVNQSYAEFKDLVAVQFGNNAAEILTVKKAQATTDSAVATLDTRLQAVTQSVDSVTGRVTKSEASIVSLQSAQTTLESSLTTFQQQATASFESTNQTVSQQGQSITQQSQDITAAKKDITTQSQAISKAQQDITGNAQALTQQGQTLNQQGQSINQQGQDITAAKKDINTQGQAISKAQQDITGNTQALGQQGQTINQQGLDLMQAKQDIVDTKAAVNTKMTAYADATTATAIYTMKTGVRYKGVEYDAGLSIATIADGTGIKTRVAVNANQFVVLSGSGDTLFSPFAIDGGQVFITDAFIKYTAITLAKIGELRSSNYVAGWTGTIMKSDGTFEVNGSVAGQGRLLITNNRIVSYDQYNRPAAVMGQRL